jgi:hypothetical protein
MSIEFVCAATTFTDWVRSRWSGRSCSRHRHMANGIIIKEKRLGRSKPILSVTVAFDKADSCCCSAQDRLTGTDDFGLLIPLLVSVAISMSEASYTSELIERASAIHLLYTTSFT